MKDAVIAIYTHENKYKTWPVEVVDLVQDLWDATHGRELPRG
jgi:hypothetical protein